MGGNRKTRVAAVGLAVSLAVVPAACGSSDDGVTATATTAKPAATTSTTAASTKPQTIKVTGSDYKFTGLPETAPAGSKISLTTDKSGEPHELVAVHVPESETRSAEEIGALSDADMETVLAGEPALVTIAMPGTTDTPGPVVGDGTLSEPGRYIILCTFPKGTTPEDVAKAQGPLQGEHPHYHLGMVDDITIQ